MKRIFSLFSLLLIAAVQSWAGVPKPIAQVIMGETVTDLYSKDELVDFQRTVSDATFTIKLLDDVTYYSYDDGFAFNRSGNNVTLDLNGHTLNGWMVIDYCFVCTIIDSSEEHTGKVECKDSYMITISQQGSLTIEGGTFVGDRGLYIDMRSSVTLNGGKFDVKEKLIHFDDTYSKVTLGEFKALKLADNTILTEITADVEQAGEVVFDAQSAYNYLVSLIGEKVYASYNSRIFVNEEGALQIDNGDRTPDELVVNGNVYVIGNQKFVVENGAIAHIYEMHGDEIVSEYGVVVPESELVALVGNNVYVASMDEEGESIISVSEGQIMFDNVPMSTALKAVATKIGDNYVYSAKDFDMVFVVVDGEVVRVDIGSGGEVFGSFEKQSSTPTAIDAVDAEKSGKAFKTIENGKVVIIRNGEKFDLAGRKL